MALDTQRGKAELSPGWRYPWKGWNSVETRIQRSATDLGAFCLIFNQCNEDFCSVDFYRDVQHPDLSFFQSGIFFPGSFWPLLCFELMFLCSERYSPNSPSWRSTRQLRARHFASEGRSGFLHTHCFIFIGVMVTCCFLALKLSLLASLWSCSWAATVLSTLGSESWENFLTSIIPSTGHSWIRWAVQILLPIPVHST